MRVHVSYIILCELRVCVCVCFWVQDLKDQLEESQVDKLKLRGALSALKEDADSTKWVQAQ